MGVRSPGFQAGRVVDHVRRRLQAMVPAAEFLILDSPERTRRDAISCALKTWRRGAEPGVPHLFYYFGHGGRATFADIPEGGDRVVHYLTCAPEPDGADRMIFLRELSRELALLHRACGNVVAILDSCYAGNFRAGGDVQAFAETPPWAHPTLHASADETLAAEGHPEVVRLMGASPRREAIAADLHVNGQLVEGIGLFTNLLLRTLEELGDDWWRTSWELLAHAVRQRVIAKAGNESQWIALAGPHRRLLLSSVDARRSAVVGTAGFDGQWWIRAGRLTGVELGDEWALVDPLVDDRLEHAPLERASVEEVASNLARLGDLEPPEDGPVPFAARLTRARRRMPVFVDGSDEIAASLPATAWLECGDGRHGLRSGTGELLVVDREGEWGTVRFHTDEDGRRRALELLEDRARATRLLALAGAQPDSPTPCPITWQVGIEHEPITHEAAIAPDTALWIHLRNADAQSGRWFVSVVLIDPIGQPLLLNSSQFDGVEIEPGTDDSIGLQRGVGRRGVVLDWPEGIVERGSGRISLVMLASRRPIQLGHLVQLVPSCGLEALRMQA